MEERERRRWVVVGRFGWGDGAVGIADKAAVISRLSLARSLKLSLSLSLWGSISLLRSLSRDAMENFPKLHSTDNASNAHLCIWIWDWEVPRISCSVRAFWKHVFYGQSPPHPQAPKNKPLPVPVFYFFYFIFRLGPISLYLYTRSRPWECVSVLF